MRNLIYTLGASAALSLVTAPVFAAPGQHGPKAPTSHTTTVQTHGNPHTTTPSGKPTSSPKPTKPTTTTAGTTTTTTTSGGSTTGTTTTTTDTAPKLNPIAAKISSHPNLESKVTAMLPKGMTLNQASAGFKNQGQFIAALHVSQNLGIPFKDLRTQMVKNNLSLGQAIQTVKATANAPEAVKTAETQTDVDIKVTTTTPTTTTTATKPKGGK